MPAFLNEAVEDREPKRPRDLWAICEGLDAAEGRDGSDRYSARANYHTLYGWLSNAAAHAGLSAIKRFTRQEDGTLHMNVDPQPLTTHWSVPIAAAFVGELARAIFAAFALPASRLEDTGVALAPPHRK